MGELEKAISRINELDINKTPNNLANILASAATTTANSSAIALTQSNHTTIKKGNNTMATTKTVETVITDKHKVVNYKAVASPMLIGDNTLTYGAHITGVVGTEGRSIASILSTPKEEDDTGIIFNTFIVFNPATNEIQEITNHAWLEGSLKSINMDSYPESLRKSIIAALNGVKGIFSTSKQIPISDGIAAIVTTDSRFITTVEEVKEAYTIMIAEIQKEKLSYSAVGINDFVNRYAFKKHVMLLGARGLGKTYLVSKYLESQKIPTEFIAGHAGIESIDLLGYYIKAPDGSLVWMDGPLTAAFRTAVLTKSAFFIDEVLRIPERELNILIGALTPDSTGHYQLRTNRIVGTEHGLGKSETLKVPVENLWAIATTNIGSDYNTEDIDLALSDRFRMYEMKHSMDAVRSIVESCNIHFDPKVVDQLMNLYTAVESLVKTKELTNTMNVRYLCEILSMCENEKELRSYIFDLTSNVCSRTTDGDINEVEEKIFKDTVKRLIK